MKSDILGCGRFLLLAGSTRAHEGQQGSGLVKRAVNVSIGNGMSVICGSMRDWGQKASRFQNALLESILG